MPARAVCVTLLCLFVPVTAARPAQPEIINVDPKEKPKPPDKDKKLTDPPKTDLFTLPPVMGSQFATGFNPHMMGDLQGAFVQKTVTLTGTQTTTTSVFDGERRITTVTTKTTPTSQTVTVLVPVPSAGSFKISENESPRPVDRVFFTWNYFSNIADPQGAPVAPVDANQLAIRPNVGLPGTTTTQVNTSIPGLPRTTANLHREVLGFEKTFLDGYASIELRLPLIQQSSNIDGFSARNVADLTIVGKYAFLLDRDTGNVFSAGLAVTAPTGPGIDLPEGTLHSTYLQPWVGYIWNSDRFFLQAFHSVVFPTDSRDVTLLFNDVGLNYWLYRGDPNRVFNFVVPMIEAHVTTPLNHRDGAGPIFVPDIVVITGGVHFGLFGNGTLSLGVATPVSGPRPFNVEGFMQLNWRF